MPRPQLLKLPLMRSSLLIFALTAAVAFAQPSFTDIADSRYREAITYLHGREVLGGFPDGTFRPRQAMTRAEFLSVVITAAQLTDAPVSGQCLADLPEGAWFAPVVCQGVALGLISSEPAELRPHDTVLYSEALKMVLTAFGFEVPAPGPGEAWYAPFVSFAAEQGILATFTYRPTNFVTREVAASILYRSLVLSGENRPPVAEPAPA